MQYLFHRFANRQTAFRKIPLFGGHISEITLACGSKVRFPIVGRFLHGVNTTDYQKGHVRPFYEPTAYSLPLQNPRSPGALRAKEHEGCLSILMRTTVKTAKKDPGIAYARYNTNA